MILVIGDPGEAVTARLLSALQRRGANVGLLDERHPSDCRITAPRAGGRTDWCLQGGTLTGRRRVEAVFLRPAERPMGVSPRAFAALRRRIDMMLLSSGALVANRSTCAMPHYSKPYQLLRLAAAGFEIPRTLITQREDEARGFIAGLEGRVVIKGISSLRSATVAFSSEHLQRLPSLAKCPAQLQERVTGQEFRVTVVGSRAFANTVGAEAGPACDAGTLLPAELVERCIAFTEAEGLQVSGIDLVHTQDDRYKVFEINPYPFHVHFENETQPVISEALADVLLNRLGRSTSNLLA